MGPFATEDDRLGRPARRSGGSVMPNGQPRAWVPLGGAGRPGASTLWIDVGGAGGLAPIERAELAAYLDEASALDWPLRRLVFIGRRNDGDPNADGFDQEPLRRRGALELVAEALERGFETVIASAADAAASRRGVTRELTRLADAHGPRLGLALGLAHHDSVQHDAIRGPGLFDTALKGLAWATEAGLPMMLTAGCADSECPTEARKAYDRLFRRRNLRLNALDPAALRVIKQSPVEKRPREIAATDWSALARRPEQMTCAFSRTLIKREGAAPSVMACPFILDDPAFEFGAALSSSERPTTLSHPRCSSLCAAPCAGAVAKPRARRRAPSPRSHAEVSNR